jgi:hypothetical protein
LATSDGNGNVFSESLPLQSKKTLEGLVWKSVPPMTAGHDGDARGAALMVRAWLVQAAPTSPNICSATRGPFDAKVAIATGLLLELPSPSITMAAR